MSLTPIQELDKVLSIFYAKENRRGIHNLTIKERLAANNVIIQERRLAEILVKLVKDGFLRIEIEETATIGATRVENVGYYLLTFEGELFQIDGGYDFKIQQDLDNMFLAKEQIQTAIDANSSATITNASTQKLNDKILPASFIAQEKFGNRSLLLAGISALFILVTIILQMKDHTADHLKGIKEELQNQSKELENIRNTLQQLKVTTFQKSTDTSRVSRAH